MKTAAEPMAFVIDGVPYMLGYSTADEWRKSWPKAIALYAAPQVGEVERLRQQFQRETLRTSQLACQLRRFVELHEAEHAPGPWARGCALCECVGQAQELLNRPLGEAPLSDEQIMDLPAGVNNGSLSFLLRFAREVERAHGIETPNVF